MSARPTELSVFEGERLVGTIHDTIPLSFTYSDEWLDHAAGHNLLHAIANIHLQPGRISSPAVEAAFENLLPEGALRDLLSMQTKSSGTFSLLLAVAGDTAGNLTILPAGEKPEPPTYKPTSWEALAAQISGSPMPGSESIPSGSRISLSGAQTKLLISLDTESQPLIPQGTSPSTWILKPNIRAQEQVWHSAANEAILMRTALHCNLNAAEVFYEATTKACVVKRFDRIQHPDGTVQRLRQFDFCQLAGLGSARKYEIEGGPGAARFAELIRTFSSTPAADLKRLCQWILFNLFTGNNDGHAKNLSLYAVPGQGLRLTPFYDLMDTRIYPGLSGRFSFRIGGEDAPGKITKEQIHLMAAEMKLKPSFVLNQAEALSEQIAPAMEKAIAEIGPSLDPSAQTLAGRLQQHVHDLKDKLASRLHVL